MMFFTTKHSRRLLLTCFIFLVCTGVAWAQSSASRLKQTLELSKRYPDSAFLMLKELNKNAAASNDERTLGISLQQMGEICYSQGHYAQALDYHQQAAKLFASLNDYGLMADNLNDLGDVYYQNIDKKSSKKHFEQALKLYKHINDPVGLGETYGNIGHLFEKQQTYDSAFHYQRKALAEYQKAEHVQGMAKIYENLGSIFEDLVRYDSAKIYFDRSLKLYKAANNEVGSIEVINNLGDVLRKMGNYTDGMSYSRSALKMSLATHNEYQEASAYRDIARTYNLMGRNDSAFHYLELSRKVLLNIYSDNNNKQMSFLQIMYNTDKKNDEIARLENNHKVNVVIGIAAVIVTLLLVIMGVLTISRQRLKLKESETVVEKNEQLRLAQEEQLALKSKELYTHTLQVIQHNQFLETMREKMDEMIKEDKRDQKRQLTQLMAMITKNINHDQQWKDFTQLFEQLHQSFFDDLKSRCEDLTVNDIRLVALLKMNMSAKDMAAIFGISQDSLRVARYRLRKKLKLTEGDSLTSFIQSLSTS